MVPAPIAQHGRAPQAREHQSHSTDCKLLMGDRQSSMQVTGAATHKTHQNFNLQSTWVLPTHTRTHALD